MGTNAAVHRIVFVAQKERENSLELATDLDVARGAADGVEGVRGEDAAGDERRPEHRPGRQDGEKGAGPRPTPSLRRAVRACGVPSSLGQPKQRQVQDELARCV